jgi:hypothetical protein
MAKSIKVEGGGKVPSKDKKQASKPRIIPKNHKLPTEDGETINLAVAAMAGRKYKKRTKKELLKDKSPRIYKNIREKD